MKPLIAAAAVFAFAAACDTPSPTTDAVSGDAGHDPGWNDGGVVDGSAPDTSSLDGGLDDASSPDPGDAIRLGELLAFPTARGYGRHTSGGRGGAIVHVTTLDRRGAGSFFEAIRTEGPRTVVFDVSGYLETGWLTVREPGLTIAGQTAPGDGVTFRSSHLSVAESETVIRHLRLRPGSGAPDGADALNVVAGADGPMVENVVIDHCSLSWGLDENSAFQGVRNVTYQNNLNTEPLNNYAILVGRNVANLSMLRNMFIHAPNRVPESTYGFTPEAWEFVNNLIYNYNRPTVVAYGVEADVIGNIYHAYQEPAIPNMRYVRNNINNPEGEASDGRVHQSDNLQLGSNPHGMTNSTWTAENQPSRIHTDSPYAPIPSAGLADELLPDVGANVFEDPVDARVLAEYSAGTGIRGPTSEEDVGGYPALANETRPADYDANRDGIADAFAAQLGVTDATDRPDTFTIDGLTFDNRAYSGGSFEGLEYRGGTLTGENLYTWFEIFLSYLAGDFDARHWR